MKSINILAVSNGVGITKDVSIIKNVLTSAGYEVEANHTFRYVPKRRFDMNIHLERFNPNHFALSDLNVMIPNQEWFEKSWIPALKAFDCIFTKTQFSDVVFKKLGCKTRFISFTSEDRYIPSLSKDNYHWIHIAGKSIQKQTETVIRTWAVNPGFPQLTIVQDHKFWKPRNTLRNVNFMIDRVPDDILKVMQNVNSVHVCPSETEGFGHYIMEAMSAMAVVITTNGPPMNELIDENRGVLVESVRNEAMNLSIKWIVDEKSLADAVIKTTVLDSDKRLEITNNARKFFLSNDANFRQQLVDAVATLFQEGPTS